MPWITTCCLNTPVRRFRMEILVSPGMCGDACPGSDEEYRLGKNGKPFPGLHKDRSLKQAVKLENPSSLNGTLTASTFFKAIQKALDQKQLNVSETHSYGACPHSQNDSCFPCAFLFAVKMMSRIVVALPRSC